MELCKEYGIPHSQFRGIGDGTWTTRDRDKALALHEYQRTVCPQCGTRADDWDQGGDDDTDDAYVAITHRCVGCQVIADKQSDVHEGASGHGVKVLLIPASVHAATQALKQLQAQYGRNDD